MAMMRTLWELAFDGREPSFNRPPFELGSFDDIAHKPTDESATSSSFRADCSLQSDIEGEDNTFSYQINVEFENQAWMPVLKKLKVSSDSTWIECVVGPDERINVLCGVNEDVWELDLPTMFLELSGFRRRRVLPCFKDLRLYFSSASLDYEKFSENFKLRKGASTPLQEDVHSLRSLCSNTIPYIPPNHRAYASAPVRSAPIRTYEVARLIRDIEGRHTPMYLAYLYRHRKKWWIEFKRSLEQFGHTSGLFDKIRVKNLDTKSGSPFQLEVGWSRRSSRTVFRNLTDVGYGVSQVLPILTEVLRRDARQLLLFQQPEVHLHPRAQAALGSLFCNIAGKDHQIIVETHSDYILDRIRMDIRDQECKLRYRDVAILFFERSGSNVKIHPIKLDTAGNIVDAPPSYRQFFLRETDRLFRY